MYMIKKITSAGETVEAHNQNQHQKMISDTVTTCCWLTEPELEAAYQLIQLSGDSAASYSSSSSSGAKGNSLDHLAHNSNNKCEAESVGDGEIINCNAEIKSPSFSSSSSKASAIIRIAESLDVCEEVDVCNSLRKRKFRSVADLYANTKPLIKKACSSWKKENS